LEIPSWSTNITPQSLKIFKVSGSLTNAVFFVSSSFSRARTLLLRIYGVNSATLISRPHELHILHVLSSRYNIGPRLYGTFENGRVEEYFDAIALTPSDLRDKTISRSVGARMAELHSVDIDLIEPVMWGHQWADKSREIEVKKNVKSWLVSAREVLALPSVPSKVRKTIDLDAFEREWDLYLRWLSKIEDADGPSKRVFAHNDAQYGNLLRLNKFADGAVAHRQVSLPPCLSFFFSSPFYRYSWWTSNTLESTQLLSISLTTSTNGRRITTRPPLISWIHRDTQRTKRDAISIAPTWSILMDSRLSMTAYWSGRSSNSINKCVCGAQPRTQSGRCGHWSKLGTTWKDR
jgi:thiamine kinase-like enzyme